MQFLDNIPWVLLVFARLTSFMVSAPFFSTRTTPNLLKVGLGALLTLLIMPTLPSLENVPVDMLAYSLWLVKEVVVGLVLGYAATLTFTAVRIAGGLVDWQMGFAMATLLDPENQSNNTLLGQFVYLIQILLFLAVNGHHMLLMGISYSYSLIPVTAAVFNTGFVMAIVKVFIEMFSLGVRIAAPFMVVFLFCDLALGIMARSVPQLNVFILSFPLKTAFGLVTMVAIMPLMAVFVNHIISEMERNMTILMGLAR